MDVHLLVYDLSRGLAREMSLSLLGFQLDAIYHTSIQLNGMEYVYDGGIIAIIPGSSHLGRPLQQIHLGKTELPMDIVYEYLDSLRPIFTVEVCSHCICHPRLDLLTPFRRLTTCGNITATTSLTHLPSSSWGKVFQAI
jgi:PPPDE putative peptidase domain